MTEVFRRPGNSPKTKEAMRTLDVLGIFSRPEDRTLEQLLSEDEDYFSRVTSRESPINFNLLESLDNSASPMEYESVPISALLEATSALPSVPAPASTLSPTESATPPPLLHFSTDEHPLEFVLPNQFGVSPSQVDAWEELPMEDPEHTEPAAALDHHAMPPQSVPPHAHRFAQTRAPAPAPFAPRKPMKRKQQSNDDYDGGGGDGVDNATAKPGTGVSVRAHKQATCLVLDKLCGADPLHSLGGLRCKAKKDDLATHTEALAARYATIDSQHETALQFVKAVEHPVFVCMYTKISLVYKACAKLLGATDDGPFLALGLKHAEGKDLNQQRFYTAFIKKTYQAQARTNQPTLRAHFAKAIFALFQAHRQSATSAVDALGRKESDCALLSSTIVMLYSCSIKPILSHADGGDAGSEKFEIKTFVRIAALLKLLCDPTNALNPFDVIKRTADGLDGDAAFRQQARAFFNSRTVTHKGFYRMYFGICQIIHDAMEVDCQPYLQSFGCAPEDAVPLPDLVTPSLDTMPAWINSVDQASPAGPMENIERDFFNDKATLTAALLTEPDWVFFVNEIVEFGAWVSWPAAPYNPMDAAMASSLAALLSYRVGYYLPEQLWNVMHTSIESDVFAASVQRCVQLLVLVQKGATVCPETSAATFECRVLQTLADIAYVGNYEQLKCYLPPASVAIIMARNIYTSTAADAAARQSFAKAAQDKDNYLRDKCCMENPLARQLVILCQLYAVKLAYETVAGLHVAPDYTRPMSGRDRQKLAAEEKKRARIDQH